MLDAYVTLGSRSNETPNTVVVLGVARGGTSMVAGVLRILDVDMGVAIESANNEDKEFILHRGDRRVFNNPDYSDKKIAYLKSVNAYIDTRNRSGDLWGWKDPLASYYIRDVAGRLKRPAYIGVTRDLTAISIRERFEAKSTNPENVPAYLLNAAHDYIRIVQFLANVNNGALLISYERALRQPMAVVHAIRDLLCLRENCEAEEKAARFIAPDRGAAHIDIVSTG